MDDFNITELETAARKARRLILDMITDTKSSHIGSALSIVDILTVLYFRILRVDPGTPDSPDRDRFILSKGHGCAGLYSILHLREFFEESVLAGFCRDEGCLTGHPVRYAAPGIEATTGSLGHGLSISSGIALAGKRDDKDYRVFTLMGDGECDEGSVWEAAMFASQHRLDNLVTIIDYNKLQGFGAVEEIIGLDPLAARWQAFGWSVKEVDGHDFKQLYDALSKVPFETGKPSVVIAHTTKGKWISYMENRLAWHYKSPDEAEYRQAAGELA